MISGIKNQKGGHRKCGITKCLETGKVSKTKFENFGTLRHDFGISDTRNAFHGSDSMQNAFDELSIVFGEEIKSLKSIQAVEGIG